MGQSFEMRLTETILIFFMLMPLTACDLFGEPMAKGKAIDSKVLEVETNKPIAGAIITARWVGQVSSLADSSEVCFHVASTTTDAQGNYHIPTWRKKTKFARAKNKTVKVSAFKPQYHYAKMNPKDNTAYVRKFKGTSREWMDELRGALSRTGCANGGASNKNRLSLINALREEAKKIATTTRDEKFLQALARISAREQAQDSNQ